jgi:hypothetical protein
MLAQLSESPSPHTGEKPDFYLGSFDTAPEHWGGTPRWCWVIDRPRVVTTGRELWRVVVDPPIPRWEEDLVSISEWVNEWILAERYIGERIEDMDSLRHVTVNIHGYDDPRAKEKMAFDSVDLVHEYIGHVALTLELVEPPPIA